MADVRAYASTGEGSVSFGLSHEGIIQDSFSMGSSTKIDSDAKYFTESGVPAKKRKTSSNGGNLNDRNMELFIWEAQHELDELLEVFKQVSSCKLNLGEGNFAFFNTAVACLLEESCLSFSKLVDEIYSKVRVLEGFLEITLVSVRSSVLLVGQRTMYGIVNEDVGVLEDESANCLWCWETRDFKLLPKVHRGFFNVRRMTRRKIQERIFALSKVKSALSMPQSNANYRSDVLKASKRLGKTLNVAGIRSLVGQFMQRSYAEMAEKESRFKEKELKKELEKNKQDAEKGRKRIDRDYQSEKLQAEKELRVQEEALKVERRHDKEAAELSKQIKKQEELAKRDQWRQEKEAAELRKQITIQKQAKIMERFLNCKKVEDPTLSTNAVSTTEEPFNTKGFVHTITSLMDHALCQQESLALNDLHRLHIIGWHKASSSNRSNRWGLRQKPKINLFREFKLHGSFSEALPIAKAVAPDNDIGLNKLNCPVESSLSISLSEHIESVSDLDACQGIGCIFQINYHSVKKLLQFDMSNRPAYYGTWSWKSGIVGPRHPLKKDPPLDYEFESDEEWEAELGESLSECEGDREDELLNNENLKDGYEDENEDSFIIPDGSLSENEGVHFDSTPESIDEAFGNSICSQMDNEKEEPKAFFQKQKYINTLTWHALGRCHPLMITNLMHEKDSITSHDTDGTAKLEQICLQFLCMQPFPGGSVDISIHHPMNTSSPSPTASGIPDSELPGFLRS